MKILQINTVYKNGGSTGRIVYELKTLAENNGIDSFVVYGYETASHQDPHTLCLQGTFRRKLNILRTRLFARHGFYNEYETKKLLKYIDEVKPDIIHLHNIHNHYVHVGRLFDYIKQKNIPVVWTLHDCWPFTGWCAYFDYAQCDRWKTGCYSCKLKHRYPCSWFIDRSRKNYIDKKSAFQEVKNLILVTPSQWLANLTRGSFLKEYPVEVINNGVNTDIFKPSGKDVKTKLGIAGKKMILAMAMYFSPIKGRDYLLTLPSLLQDDEVLVFVGMEKSQQHLLPKNNCIGVLRTNSPQELAEYYSAADVFINPTLEDNFPTTNIEALACGTPVITFQTGGSVESVDEKTGFVVPQGDLDAMLQAIRVVESRGKEYYEKACREKALERYNKDKQYYKYIELYKKICD